MDNNIGEPLPNEHNNNDQMDFNLLQQNENNLTDFNQIEQSSEFNDNFEQFTQEKDVKSPEKKSIQQIDDQLYELSADFIHQGSNSIQISLIVNQYETEFKSMFSNEITLQEVVNYFKTKTQDDQLVPINFKIPRTQINNLSKKVELPIKWLIHNPNIFLKCSSQNEQWLKKEEIPTKLSQQEEEDEIPIV